MPEIFAAFAQALRDMTRGDIFWHLLWPPMLAAVFWGVVGFLIWAHGLSLMTQIVPQLPWSGWEWLAHWVAVFLLLASFATLIYLTTMLLVALVAMPYLINYVAARDYPDLLRHGQHAFARSLTNTLVAGLVFLVGGLLSLPLLLIPGVILVLPLFWTAWLNQRTFRVDALVEHATAKELSHLVQAKKSRFYLAGTGCALLAHVPVVQLVVPVYTALVFVHLSLASLREQRQHEGVMV